MSLHHSIYLVDDHAMVRTALKEMIEKSGPYTVAREFTTGLEFISAYPFDPPPGLLILDLSMPDMNGTQVIEWMRDNNVDIRTLVLTFDDSEDRIVKLFRMGIRGYLKKKSSAAELNNAINDIISYGYYHNELLTRAIKDPGDRTQKTQRELVLEQLSERELHFLQLVCDEAEYTYDQIGSIMNVHRRTLDGYRESLFSKFNIKSKPGLVLFALKNQIVSY